MRIAPALAPEGPGMAERRPAPGSSPGERVVELVLGAESSGRRIDLAVAALLPELSRAALQRLIAEGRVLADGRVVRASHRVRGGERVSIAIPAPAPAVPLPEPRVLSILYEDADLVVLDKPAGVAVHPGAGRPGGTLVNFLLHHCRDLSGVGGQQRPGIVHRLDRDTSGALVVAKNDAAHRGLSEQFKERQVRKIYDALVWGDPRPSEGTIDAPIGRHSDVRVKMAIRASGRSARTAYRVVRRLGPASLLEVRPETGRTHQIRVHLQSIGHPVVGDPIYGRRPDKVREGGIRDLLEGYSGLALHARRLGFTHPRTGAWIECEAPWPGGLAALLSSLERMTGGAQEESGR